MTHIIRSLSSIDIEELRQWPLFDAGWYSKEYPDVALTGIDPAEHYLWIGATLNRRAGPHAERGGMPISLASDSAATAKHDPANSLVTETEPDATAWPPPPINDFWPTQKMRDFIIEGYGESVVPLYWYLSSVMTFWTFDQRSFVENSKEISLIMARLAVLAREGSESGVGNIDATIIIPVYNNILDTLLCLTSVLEASGKRTFEIVVADDASSDATSSLIPGIGGNVTYIRQPQNVGFLRNCNLASTRTRGRYIVLLNNDTFVLPGWLDRLLEPFNSDPRVGLTGSKLVNFDGTLQEAGGIFWADGSAWNFGRGSAPRAPQYSYVKEVDYCSGASIAITRALWDALSGFDEHYLPAYCEDSDLAFRVRDAGWKTVYTPFSEVIHHEGRSHGRDLNSGIKASQVINQAKLFKRWRELLHREHFPNGTNVLRARDRSRLKNHVLVVDHYVPQWDRDAGSRTIFQFIQALVAKSWQVTFWPDNLWYDPDYAPKLQEMGVEIIYGADFIDGFPAFCQERSDLFDLALLSRPHVAVNYVDALRAHTSATIFYYGHDIHYLRMQRHRDLSLPDAPSQLEIEEMRAQEIEVCTSVDLVLYPSQEEATQMQALLPDRVTCLAIPPFCFLTEEFHQASEVITKRTFRQGRINLIFVGGFAHTPNRDAISWFVRDVLPQVTETIDPVFTIVGSNPPHEISALASEKIEIHGFVSDQRLLELYEAADIVVAPLRYGAGVKGKVVEAVARGVPVVTTTIGAQGLDAVRPYLFVGDSAEEFAEAILLASDRSRAAVFAKAALSVIREEFSQSKIANVLGKRMP